METLLTKDHGIKINFKDMEFFIMKYQLNLMIHSIIKTLIILKSIILIYSLVIGSNMKENLMMTIKKVKELFICRMVKSSVANF